MPVAQSQRRVVVVKKPIGGRVDVKEEKDQDYNDYDYDENRDKSYSFGYQESASTRHEQSDEAGNVRGEYSYINAEGNQIVVRYRASPEGGFEIENEEELSASVARATADGAAAAAAARTSEHRQRQQQELILNARARQTLEQEKAEARGQLTEIRAPAGRKKG